MSQMGLLKRPSTQDELLPYEWESVAPAESQISGVDERLDDSDPLRAARGTALGVTLGAIVWGVILWVLL
jgi:hypothetical protein